MEGCELVIHTASPFLLGKIRDPEKQLVKPAVEGTRNVLDSVNATESVKRVVLTSSVVAIQGDNIDMLGRGPFTEDDWNTTSSRRPPALPLLQDRGRAGGVGDLPGPRTAGTWSPSTPGWCSARR